MLEIADRVVMKRDLQIAREIQTWLLPGRAAADPGHLGRLCHPPGQHRGGRLLRRFSAPRKTYHDENRVVFAVADVAGKSIPAAMLMATFQASLKTLSTAQVALPELVANMNKYACSNSQGGLRFTTAFLAGVRPRPALFTYINAGTQHSNPARGPTG